MPRLVLAPRPGAGGSRAKGLGTAGPTRWRVLLSMWRKGSLPPVSSRLSSSVRPRVGVGDDYVHAEAGRPESPVEERVRRNAEDFRADNSGEVELGGVGFGYATGQEHLAPGDGEGERYGARGRFPQPVPDLVVKGRRVAGLQQARVVRSP